MSTIRCPQCNLTNFATAVACKRCGYFFQPLPEGTTVNPAAAETSFGAGEPPPGFNEFQNGGASAGYAPQPPFGAASTPPPRQNYYQPQYQTYQTAKQKSGLAIASLVLGVIGCFFTSPIGLILGIVAMVKARRHPHQYGGKGLAIAGIVLNGLGLLFLPVIAAIAIPNLLAARRAANEGSAVKIVHTLASAEQVYMGSMNGKCGDIQALIATKLVNDLSLAKNEKNGYRFLVINLPAGGCEIHATPLSTSQGTRSFFYSTEDNVIRAAKKNGLPADRKDLPLGNDMFDEPEQTVWGQPPSEQGAISSLRTLRGAQMTYTATMGAGNCGDLRDLAREQLIKRDLADGESGGYRFEVIKLNSSNCDITATPISSSQARSFYIGYDGVVRGKAKNGQPADKSDPPLN
jgi:hypothetical protein